MCVIQQVSGLSEGVTRIVLSITSNMEVRVTLGVTTEWEAHMSHWLVWLSAVSGSLSGRPTFPCRQQSLGWKDQLLPL